VTVHLVISLPKIPYVHCDRVLANPTYITPVQNVILFFCYVYCVCLLQASRAARSAEGPTPEMYGECQELLQLFGIPYIVAPVEVSSTVWTF